MFRSILLLTGLIAGTSWAEIQVTDAKDRTVTMAQPAQRIISLAPHLTELLFEVGAGTQIIATTEWSNYPKEAKQIPRIGDYFALNIEAIIQLQPDLIVAWPGGPTLVHVQRLESLGFTVFYSDPSDFDGIEKALLRLGQLTGKTTKAQQQQKSFHKTLNQLAQQYHEKEKVTVFYQVGYQPIYTISDDSFIHDVIQLCGGDNLFAGLPGASPQISREAVIGANPQIILSQSDDHESLVWWHRDSMLAAVQQQQLYLISPDHIARPTPSLIQGAKQICQHIDQARQVFN